MAKKRANKKSGTKSEAIRAVLKANPKATVKQIQSALTTRGVKASNALVNKIKYGRKSTPGRQSAKRHARGAGVSKAESIRQAWSELGHHARPRDVVATLASRGVAVSSAQVSTLRHSAPSNGKATASAATVSVSLDHLLAAKALAIRLGGIEIARQALTHLAKLIDN